METQFQPMTDPSVPADIEMFDLGLSSKLMAPASEPNLTNPQKFQEAIRGLKVRKAPGPNGIPNRALKHLTQRMVFLLVLIFNAILLSHHFPTVWKHARVISILKPGKDPALPPSGQAKQAKVLTGGGDLREAHVDFPCVRSQSWAQ